MNYVSLRLTRRGFPAPLSERAAVRAQSKTTFSWQCLKKLQTHPKQSRNRGAFSEDYAAKIFI